PAELDAVRAEAGRRLLSAADAGAEAETPKRSGRIIIAAGVVLTSVLALGLYILLGSPGVPDQPYKRRVAEWRTGDVGALDPPKMAAVLRLLAAERPKDPKVYDYLGRAELAAGNAFAAQRAFERALQMQPGSAELHASIGQAMVAGADGKVTPEAQAEFRKALAIDPRDILSRYHLARASLAAGDTQGGVAALRALAGEFPEGDPRRQAILAEAGPVAGAPPAGALPPEASGDQAVFIRAMVARQAAKLKAQPNDPEGWARLVRSYGVLGDKPAQQAALADARRALAGRAADLAKVEAEAGPAPAN
ncbi:MAG: c-type cytochrome biogenesis protein CcmI, partial [Caulobacteraceae bacterium]